MADVKKIALTTIGAPKKEKKSKSAPKTVRFTLKLGESNEKSCPEFNYKDLLAAEETKKKDGHEHQNGGVSIMDVDEEDEAGLRAIARKFEEKYGGNAGGSSKPGKRKKKRSEEYVDLGAGYDDNDSFIDNTDAYDEIVPEEMTTAQGGFYINCGELEYKQLELPEVPSDGEEPVRPRKRVKQAIVSSDDSSEDDDEDLEDEEDSRDELEPEVVKSHAHQDANDTAQAKVPPKPEVIKPEVIPTKVPPAQPTSEVTVTPVVSEPVPMESQDSPAQAKKLKRPAETNSVNAGPSKKKSVTVKELLKEKREPEPKELLPSGSSPVHVPKVPATSSSMADSIESVINASWFMNDSDVQFTATKTLPPAPLELTVEKPKPNSNTEARSPEPMLTLPDGISESIKPLAEFIRTAGKKNKGNLLDFFTSQINRALLRLYHKTQGMSKSVRHQVFAYAAETIVCPPETLLKKARSLLILREKARSKEALNKLKMAIDQLTPTVLETFLETCKKYNVNSQSKDIVSKIKIYPWTLELRSLLSHAICLNVKPNDIKELNTYLETQVCPLFPSGWMDVPTLLNEANISSRFKEASHSSVVAAQSSPTQRSTSVITLAESPRLPENTTLTPTPPRPPSQQSHAPISLKQRILQDAVDGAFESKQELNSSGLQWQTKLNQASPTRPGSTDSAKHSRMTHSPSPSSNDRSSSRSDISSQTGKSNAKEKKERKNNNKSQVVKTVAAKEKNNKPESARTKKPSNSKKKPSSNDVLEQPKEAPPPPPLTKEELEAKALEDSKKMIEESDAAADFLSQIIHQSLSEFPNASNFTEERNISPKAETRHSINERVHSYAEVDPEPINSNEIEQRHTHRERKHSESFVISNNKDQHLSESRLIQEPPAVDPEASVQLEMKRVMEELMELNGQINAGSEPPKFSPIQDRLKGRSDHIESPIRSHSSPDRSVLSPFSNVPVSPSEVARSRFDKARSSVLNTPNQFNSSHLSSNSDLSITPSMHSGYSSTNSTPPHSLLEKGGRNSGVSVIAVNSGASHNPSTVTQSPMYSSFQEQFQRHALQEPSVDEVVYVNSSPPSAFRPSLSSRQQAPMLSPYPGYNQHQQPQHHHLPSPQDLRASFYNTQVQSSLHHQMLSHTRVQQYPDLQQYQQPK